MRHGEAGHNEPFDFDRELTAAGAERVRSSAARSAQKHGVPTRLMSSPLVRARQTVALVIEELNLTAEAEVWDSLVPTASPNLVLESLDDAEVPMPVTHQPFAGRFINFLSDEDSGLETAGVACITTRVLARHCGRLAWTVRG